jgi:hypothetical protein
LVKAGSVRFRVGNRTVNTVEQSCRCLLDFQVRRPPAALSPPLPTTLASPPASTTCFSALLPSPAASCLTCACLLPPALPACCLLLTALHRPACCCLACCLLPALPIYRCLVAGKTRMIRPASAFELNRPQRHQVLIAGGQGALRGVDHQVAFLPVSTHRQVTIIRNYVTISRSGNQALIRSA